MSFTFKRGFKGCYSLYKIKKLSKRKRLFKILNKDKPYQTYLTYWNPHTEWVFNAATKTMMPIHDDY